MTETPSSIPEKEKESLSLQKKEREEGISLCKELTEYTQLPVSGEMLFDAINEVFAAEVVLPTEGKNGENPAGLQQGVDVYAKQIQDITRGGGYQEWREIIKTYSEFKGAVQENKKDKDAGVTMEDLEIKIFHNKTTFLETIFDILKVGAYKEKILQEKHALEGYHLPKTAGVWVSVGIMSGQAFTGSMLTRDTLNRFLYGDKIANIYKKVLDPFGMHEKVTRMKGTLSEDMGTAKKEYEAAKKLIKEAGPGLEAELAKRGISGATKEGLYKRAIAFMVEDPIGRKIVSMTEISGKIGKGMKDSIAEPLWAFIFVLDIMNAPDKDKAVIEYFTGLFAGLVAQEGIEVVGGKALQMFGKLLPEGSPALVRLEKLMASPLGKLKGKLGVVAIIACIFGIFKIPGVSENLEKITNWMDQHIDHGDLRDASTQVLEVTSMIAAWEFTLGYLAYGQFIKRVNPFTEQFTYLSKHQGLAGVDAWDRRITDIQESRVYDHGFSRGASSEESDIQKSILEEQKVHNPESWAEKNILSFQQEFKNFQTTHDDLLDTLRAIPAQPGSSQNLLGGNEQMRFMEYALADSDIWTYSDHPISNFGTVKMSLETREVGLKENKLVGQNEKAIQWMQDQDKSTEERLRIFFRDLDSIIENEKAKCTITTQVSPGYVGVPARYKYTRDEQKYTQIEQWGKQVTEAKEKWISMQRGAQNVARYVTIARSLGVYDKDEWTTIAPPKPASLLFRGFIDRIATGERLHQLTVPQNAQQACDIIDAVAERDTSMISDLQRGLLTMAPVKDRYFSGILQSIMRDIYKSGVPQEYIQCAFEPISYLARHQAEGQYLTPGIIFDVEKQLGTLLLNRATHDKVLAGKTSPEDLDNIQCSGDAYGFFRKFTLKKGNKNSQPPVPDMIIQEDTMRVTPETWNQEVENRVIGRTPYTLDIFNTSVIQKTKVVAMIATQQEQYQKTQHDEKMLQKDVRESKKGESMEAFEDFYGAREYQKEYAHKWQKISKTGEMPIIYSGKGFIETISNRSTNVWQWGLPDHLLNMKVAIFWGPGDTKEVVVQNLKNFKYAGWDKKTQDAIRTTLISPISDEGLESILSLAERNTVMRPSLTTQNTFYDAAKELYDKLLPEFHRAYNKGSFLSKTLDVILKHGGGIGTNEVDTIYREITQ